MVLLPQRERVSTVSAPNNMFICGSISGLCARAVVLPFDMGGQKGPLVTLFRRSIHHGIVFALYFPKVQDKNKIPRISYYKSYPRRVFETFTAAGTAGLVARLLTAPFYRIADHAMINGGTQFEALKFIVMNQGGVLGLWQTQHPLLAAFWHTGAVFACFETGRRLADNLQIADNAAVNAGIGGVAGFVGSTLTYKWSWRRYQSCVLNNSAIVRGLFPTLLKEVPLTAGVFGLWTFLQPQVAPGYSHHGFGAWF